MRILALILALVAGSAHAVPSLVGSPIIALTTVAGNNASVNTVAYDSGQVLLAGCAKTFGTGNQTISGGTGITWTSTTNCRNATATNSVVWYVGVAASSQTGQTVTCTHGTGSGAYLSLAVMRLDGVDTADPIGTDAAGNCQTGNSSLLSVTVTADSDGSLVFAIGAYWNGPDTFTGGTDDSILWEHDQGTSCCDTLGGAYDTTSTTATAGKNVQLNPSGSDQWAIKGIEIRAAAGGGGTTTTSDMMGMGGER